jgi:flagellar capping protein FliD
VANLGLSGLASGVDTSAIVEQLMSLERRGKTRLQVRQGSIAAQQTTLRDLKTKLDALKTAAADLRASATWSEGQTVESSDAARVAVARTGGAPIGGYSVKVTQLAASAQKTYSWTEGPAATQLTIGSATVDIAANEQLVGVQQQIHVECGDRGAGAGGRIPAPARRRPVDLRGRRARAVGAGRSRRAGPRPGSRAGAARHAAGGRDPAPVAANLKRV